MARAKQPTTTATATTTTKSSKSKKTDTVSTPVDTASVSASTTTDSTPVPTSTSTSTSTPSTEVSDITTVFEQFSDFMTKLQTVSASMSSLKTEFRTLERRVSKDLKAAAKISQKRKRKSGNRAPSGFIIPTLISNELAKFLGKAEGSEMARTAVTSEINAYIIKHSLRDKSNGRIILPDTKLRSLLKIGKEEELTYFNLQKYMSPHFAKASDKNKMQAV
jgi:chromatin remodeling complex protein RSC6